MNPQVANAFRKKLFAGVCGGARANHLGPNLLSNDMPYG